MASIQSNSRLFLRRSCLASFFAATFISNLAQHCQGVHIARDGDDGAVGSDVKVLAVSFNLGILDVQQQRDDPIKTGVFLFPPDSLAQQDKFEVITLQYESDAGFWFATNYFSFK